MKAQEALSILMDFSHDIVTYRRDLISVLPTILFVVEILEANQHRPSTQSSSPLANTTPSATLNCLMSSVPQEGPETQTFLEGVSIQSSTQHSVPQESPGTHAFSEDVYIQSFTQKSSLTSLSASLL
jgi:hypothetical protein